MLAWHLAARYLRRRRSAWLALAAIASTVAVSVLVVGIAQGWLDQVERCFRANEADLTAENWEDRPDTAALRAALATTPGVLAVAPLQSGFGLMTPKQAGPRPAWVMAEGIDLADDVALGRLGPERLHPPPITAIAAPPLSPERRGSGFLSIQARDDLALIGLEIAGGFAALPVPAPPRTRPMPGVIVGREVLYGSGIRIGDRVNLVLSSGSGSKPGTVEISDTISSGVLQIDQHLLLMPLGLAQRMTGTDGKDGRPSRVESYRLALAPGADPQVVGRAAAAHSGLAVRTWQESRGINAVRMIASNRNLVLVMMVAIEAICILFVYAVFSTLVVEKRRDFGVFVCLGARRRYLFLAVALMGLVAGAVGGILGWAAGWTALALVNPFSELIGMPLFPQDIFYSAEAPVSFDPWVPLAFAGVMVAIGLVGALLPAWSARSVDPISTVRESA